MKMSARIAAVAAVVALMAGPAMARAAAPGYAQSAIDPDGAAGAYCKQTGGEVQRRVPQYGQSSNPLVLSGSHDFCRYKSKSDGSRIYVFIDTLYTTQPSLAALAYYAEVQPGSCQGNPAACYCTLLGGSDTFGSLGGAGGGWAFGRGEDPLLEACIFPDLSSIDSWGLAYHSQGIVRGIDLSTVLKYPDPYAKTRHGKTLPTPYEKAPKAD